MSKVRLRLPASIEYALLALAPVVSFFALRVRPMAKFDVIDAGFYGAYAQHGQDLMRRFGAGHYFWVRLGFIVPAKICYALFGALGGFYTLRYLLALVAIVPLYWLLRSLHGRGAGAVGVLIVLTSPVIYNAWGDDYPDSAALSYVLGGACLLLLETSSRRRRVAALLGSGLLFGLALNCQVVTAPLVVTPLFAYAVLRLRRGTVLATVRDLAWSIGGVLLATAGAVVIAKAWLGHWNIFSPTIENYKFYQLPAELPLWHSDNWRWVSTVPYAVVPGAVAVAWVAVAVVRRPARTEVALGLGAVLSIAAFYYLQFIGTTATLEYKLYSSMLRAPVSVLLSLVIVTLVRGVLAPTLRAWGPPVLVAAVALIWSIATPSVQLLGLHRTLLVAAVLVLGAVLAALPVKVRTVAGPFGVVVVLVSAFLLITAPTSKPALAKTSPYIPHGDYSATLGHPSADETDVYAVAAQVPGVVGQPTAAGQQPAFWFPKDALPAFNQVSTEYLWLTLDGGIPTPETMPVVLDHLNILKPSPLILLGSNDHDFAQFLSVMSNAGITSHVVRSAKLSHGSFSVVVWVVDLDRFTPTG